LNVGILVLGSGPGIVGVYISSLQILYCEG
jgi:hypothetical protein